MDGDGTIVVNDDGSGPIDIAGGGSFTSTGSATYSTTLPSDPKGSTGHYAASPESQHVEATYQVPGEPTKTEPIAETPHSTSWTCQRNALSLVIEEAGVEIRYALVRQG